MSKKVKIILFSFLGLIGAGLLSILLFMGYMFILSRDLPSVEEMAKFKYSEPMVVYDSKGEVIAELGAERRYPIPISEMSEYMPKAVIAVEDARFYEHSGIDFVGIMRAMIANVKAGRLIEGGSTLTQQLVKNLYLSPERKIKRKLKEAILAYQFDKHLSKENILELYLNQVNFGRGAYGVQAAAINYFGKNAKDLTLSECAVIAAIPKAPGLYAPHLNMKRSITRRNHVLSRMYDVGYITEAEYNKAIEEPIIIQESVPLKLRHAGYFMDHIHKYLSEDLKLKEEEKLGLKIYTTLNIDYQVAAEKALKENLIELSKKEGFLGTVGKMQRLDEHAEIDEKDNSEITEEEIEKEVELLKTSSLETPSYLAVMGIKKAVVKKVEKNVVEIDINGTTGIINLKDNDWAKPAGSGSGKLNDFNKILKVDDIIYVSKDKRKENVYNIEQDPEVEGSIVTINPKTGEIYAMVGGFSYEKSFFNRATQAQRQMGSIFKPIVYATAFESGKVPMDVILDVPVIAEEEEGDKVWKPKNFEDKFYGETTLKEALIKSRNIVTIKVAEDVGIRKIIRYAKKFGIESDMPVDLSVSLGSASASPLTMAYVYSVFANEGSRPETPYFITKIEDIDGKVLYEFLPPEQVEVIDSATAALMNDMLIGVVESGTGWRAKALQRRVAAKTGTTNDSKDAWFSGYIPNLVTVAWVGYDDFSSMGSYATGSSAAAPVWVNYMKEITKDLPYELFPANNNVAYFKVDKETKKITDSFVGDYSFEIYPVDDNGKPTAIKK